MPASQQHAPFEVAAFLTDRGLLSETGDTKVRPLAGGYWNEIYRVRSGGDIDWVVKHFRVGQGESLFPNLPESEARALEVLRGAEVAPRPVAFFEAREDRGPVLVYEFLAGEPWKKDVGPVAALFRRQHAIEAEGFRQLPVDPAELLDQGDALMAELDDHPLVQRLRDRRPAAEPGPPLDRRVLVHGDAGPGNLVAGDMGVRLIDWQCPGLGDPAEDLWTFIAPAFQILYQHAPLSAGEIEDFLDAYGEPAVSERLAWLTPALAYRMTAYCVRRHLEMAARDPAVSRRYATAVEAQMETFAETGRGEPT